MKLLNILRNYWKKNMVSQSYDGDESYNEEWLKSVGDVAKKLRQQLGTEIDDYTYVWQDITFECSCGETQYCSSDQNTCRNCGKKYRIQVRIFELEAEDEHN